MIRSTLRNWDWKSEDAADNVENSQSEMDGYTWQVTACEVLEKARYSWIQRHKIS